MREHSVQRNARCPRTQRTQDVAHAAVIDTLRPHLSGSVRAKGEDDSVHTGDRTTKRVGASDIADDHLRFVWKPTGLARGAHQGTHGMALTECFLIFHRA